MCARCVDNNDVVAGDDARSHVWTICGSSDAIVPSYGLLSSSCRSFSTAAARKAIKIWAARRWSGGVDNGQFGIVHMRVPSTGRIWQCPAGRTPSCVLSLRGSRVEGSGGTRGIKKVSRLIVKLGSWGWPQTNNVPFVKVHILAKKYGHHTILRWCHTNLGSLYMMVPSDWQGNFV